jgi:hypothetical protein
MGGNASAIKVASAAPLHGSRSPQSRIRKKAGIPQNVAKEFVASDKNAAKKKLPKGREPARKKV